MTAGPMLVVEFELEQEPRMTIVAATLEDERRLRWWLSRSMEPHFVAAMVGHALDDVDRHWEAA